MKNYRTSVGLDVHARSVVGCGLDRETGEVFERRLTPNHQEILESVRGLSGRRWRSPMRPARRVRVGAVPACRRDRVFGSSALEVAAPIRDRVKTDTRDARHLARLLHLGEIVEVTIPGIEQEAARDLVQARDDVRGDLMSARHRVSKLLLPQEIVYSGGKAWTGKHELSLRSHTFATPGRQLAYDAAFDAMVSAVDRRDRLDKAIVEMAADSVFTPVVTRLRCLRGVSTLTAFGWPSKSETGDA